jgi:hypothetical protein
LVACTLICKNLLYRDKILNGQVKPARLMISQNTRESCSLHQRPPVGKAARQTLRVIEKV